MAFSKRIKVQSSSFQFTAQSQRLLLSFFAVIIFLGIMFFVHRVSQFFYFRIDLTEDNLYSLHDVSKDLVKGLEDPVTIKAYFPDDLPTQVEVYKAFLMDKLAEYEKYGQGNFHYEFLDPSSNSEIESQAASYGIVAQQLQSFEEDEISLKTNVYVGIVFLYQDQVDTISQLDQQMIVELGQVEYDITSRIKQLVAPDSVQIGYLQDDNTASFQQVYGQLYQALDQLYGMQPLSGDQIAQSGVDVLLVMGQQSTLSETTLFQIEQAIMRGSNVLYLVDGIRVDLQQGLINPFDSGLAPLLEHYGVRVQNQMVVSPVSISNYFGGILPQHVTSPDLVKDSPITNNLVTALFPFPTPLEPVELDDDSIKPLMVSSPDSWTQSSFTSGFSQEFAQNFGRQTLALQLEKPLTAYYDQLPEGVELEEDQIITEIENSRQVIIGGSYFASSEILGNLPEENLSILLNSVDWLAQDDGLLAIRSKVSTPEFVDLTKNQKDIVKWGNVLGLPIFITIIGVGYFFRRRHLMQRTLR